MLAEEEEMDVLVEQSVHTDFVAEVWAERTTTVKGELCVWNPMYRRYDGTICDFVVWDRPVNSDVGELYWAMWILSNPMSHAVPVEPRVTENLTSRGRA